MTTKEEFKKLFPYNGIIIEDNGEKYSLNDIYSYFQSKQQEKIEEIKKLTKGKGGTKYGIWADGYLDAIKKVLEILEGGQHIR